MNIPNLKYPYYINPHSHLYYQTLTHDLHLPFDFISANTHSLQKIRFANTSLSYSTMFERRINKPISKQDEILRKLQMHEKKYGNNKTIYLDKNNKQNISNNIMREKSIDLDKESKKNKKKNDLKQNKKDKQIEKKRFKYRISQYHPIDVNTEINKQEKQRAHIKKNRMVQNKQKIENKKKKCFNGNSSIKIQDSNEYETFKHNKSVQNSKQRKYIKCRTVSKDRYNNNESIKNVQIMNIIHNRRNEYIRQQIRNSSKQKIGQRSRQYLNVKKIQDIIEEDKQIKTKVQKLQRIFEMNNEQSQKKIIKEKINNKQNQLSQSTYKKMQTINQLNSKINQRIRYILGGINT